jgi:hypothetical protein
MMFLHSIQSFWTEFATPSNDYRLSTLKPKLSLCHKDLPLEYKPPAPEVLVTEMADYVTQTSFAASTAIEAVDTLTLQIDHSMGADHGITSVSEKVMDICR